MGSSGKRYKEKEKAERKRRHRSRSFTDDESPKDSRRHKHSRRHHHKEKDRRRDQRKHEYESNDSDVVEISDRDMSPVAQNSQQQSSGHREQSPEVNAHQHQESLSIEETNKLRAKLGLKPLQIDSKRDETKSDGKRKDDWGEFYHKPASNLAQKNESEKIRSKLSDHKEKRKIESKLAKVKLLGESDSDDDALAWVDRSRTKEEAKKIAQQRAKALEEMDEQFGVAEVLERESREKRQRKYTEKNLSGLQVEHDVNSFKEGKTVILTLKDAGVLEAEGDVLVNVNMIEDERYKKNVENKSKKVIYNPYDVEELDEFGNVKPKNLLHQYDEEIEGAKKDSFHIGSYATTSEHKQNVKQNIRAKLANKRVEFLPQSIGSSIHLASDYYNEDELEAFKKPKKKIRKIRQKSKFSADDLEKITAGKNQPEGVKEVKPEVTDHPQIEEKDDVFERALRKARRLKQRDTSLIDHVQEIVAKLKPEIKDEKIDTGSIILNTTAEFCRTLGDIPTYGKSGNREEEIEDIDYENDLVKDDSEDDCQIIEEASTSKWSSKDQGCSQVEPILDEEPDVGTGVGAALKLAMSKGYLDKEETNRPSNTRLAYLQAKHYSIEDKNYGDDNERGNRRERYSGPVQDFKERDGFKPNVKLEYIDDEGHVLNSKEAFRYLSHKFHGKGPGKNKIEKRLKKSQQEGLMKKMNSTDTPLGTLNMLQAKQKEMQSPYIVLSGGKTHSTSIAKARR